jgi:hypothetical protein
VSSSGAALLGQRLGRRPPEELDHGRDAALLLGDLGDVGRGLDPEHRHPALGEVLEQVAVVRGELHHLRSLAEAEARDGHLGVAAAVLEPAGRERREVRVVGEDRVGRLELLELHEEAALADQRVEREERLHRAELVLAEVAVRERGHAEVGERVLQRAAAEAARAGAGHGARG